MHNRICCVFNYAPHYRQSIFEKMDKELKCDFYFGDNLFFDLKKMDYSKLNGYRGELKTIRVRSFRWQFGISRFFFKNYDSYIITGDSSYLSYWLLLLNCILRRKKIYMWTHGRIDSSRGGNFMSKTFYSKATGGLLLYGNYYRDILAGNGFPPDKLHVVFNSLDYENQYRIRQNLKPGSFYKEHFHNNDPVVIFIGRLQKAKKLELIIESQKRLKERGIFFNTIFIGPGDEEQALRNMALKSGITDRVWFFGPCYEEEAIAEMIYNSALTVCPGDIGLTAIHSLVYGTPVVTHSFFAKHGPEFEAISPGETGDFFDIDNTDDLAGKISLWINKALNEEEREMIRAKCYRIVDLYYNPGYQISQLKSILAV